MTQRSQDFRPFRTTSESVNWVLSNMKCNYIPRGSVFHAIVSVMAVKIQFSSPNIVLLSFNWPGTLETIDKYTVTRATDKVRKSVITHWKSWKTHWKNIQGVKIRISISPYALGIQSSAYRWSTFIRFLPDFWHFKEILAYGYLMSTCLCQLFGLLCVMLLYKYVWNIILQDL